ncbi:hypothetical protein MKW92_040161 [Papaver armeniacum]|nr:hypothetical protein MKW92_040161 [Papaver armeniacum]
MGGAISNSLKSSLKDAVTDEEVMRPLRRQGVICFKEIVEDKDIRNQGIIWVREILQDKEIRVACGDFVPEILSRDDIIKQYSIPKVFKGIERDINYIAIGVWLGVFLYAIDTIQNLVRKTPPPPQGEEATAASAGEATTTN